MSLSPNINNREFDKFVDTDSGNTAVRVIDVNGFINEAVGNKIEAAYPSATTETYTFKNGATTYKVLLVTYTDSTKNNLSSVERTT